MYLNLHSKIIALVLALFLFSASAYVYSEEKLPAWNGDTLTGNWGSLRDNLYKLGVNIGLTHKSDVLSNVSGGLKRGSAWEGHTEMRANFDLEKLLGWDSTGAYIHFHSNLGSKFNTNYIGGVIGVDNIEVATNTAQFDHAWLQKFFLPTSFQFYLGYTPLTLNFMILKPQIYFSITLRHG